MDSSLLAALLGVLAGIASGLLVPLLVRTTPEPPASEVPAPAKIRYRTLGERAGLGGRCAVLGGVVGLAIGATVEWDFRLVAWCAALPLLGALCWIDWHTKLLPNHLMWPLIWLMTALVPVGVGLAVGWAEVPSVLAWAAGAWLFYLVLHVLHPAGIGFGDVRLSWPLGLLLASAGGAQVLAGLWLGFAIGGLSGLLLGGRGSLKRTIPFGPFMVIGALLGLFVGGWLLSGITR